MYLTLVLNQQLQKKQKIEISHKSDEKTVIKTHNNQSTKTLNKFVQGLTKTKFL